MKRVYKCIHFRLSFEISMINDELSPYPIRTYVIPQKNLKLGTVLAIHVV